MSELPEPSNVTVVESRRWPPPGKMPSEMSEVENFMDIEVIPSESLPEEMHEADKLTAYRLTRAYEEGELALEHANSLLKWFSGLEPDPTLLEVIDKIEQTLNTIAYRQSVR